jgi:hypothetical protein
VNRRRMHLKSIGAGTRGPRSRRVPSTQPMPQVSLRTHWCASTPSSLISQLTHPEHVKDFLWLQLAQGKKKSHECLGGHYCPRDKQQSCRQLCQWRLVPRGLFILVSLFALLASTALPIPPLHASLPRMTPVRRVTLPIECSRALLGQGLLSCVLLATKLSTRATSLSSFSLPMPLLVKLASLA